jgi:hypothetical protein
MNDQAGQFNQLHSQATQESVNAIKNGGSPMGPASVALSNKLADAYNPMGITVWHGSPHKFSKFDSSKIGTGEGAQAYGHGLYLAESPDVAKNYAPRDIGYEDKLMGLYKAAERRQNYDAMEVLEAAMTHSTPAELRQQFGGAAESVIKQIESIPINNGGLYKVDLPDEHLANMLDWDKPMSQQSDAVKQAIGLDKNPNASIRDMKGYEFYVGTGGKLGEPTSASRAAAEHLRNKGIHGIRYQENGSHGLGQGTSNFVVFPGNEGLLSILERNGVPVK